MKNSKVLGENRNALNTSHNRPPAYNPPVHGKKSSANGSKRPNSAQCRNRILNASFDKENDISIDNQSVKSSLDLKKLQELSVISSASMLRRQSANSLQFEQASQAEYASGGDQNKKETAYFQSGVTKSLKLNGKLSQNSSKHPSISSHSRRSEQVRPKLNCSRPATANSKIRSNENSFIENSREFQPNRKRQHTAESQKSISYENAGGFKPIYKLPIDASLIKRKIFNYKQKHFYTIPKKTDIVSRFASFNSHWKASVFLKNNKEVKQGRKLMLAERNQEIRPSYLIYQAMISNTKPPKL